MAKPKKLNKPPKLPDLDPSATYAGDGWCVYVYPPAKTSCKHGDGDCEVCGTSDATDVKHTTVNGKGAVARLRNKK